MYASVNIVTMLIVKVVVQVWKRIDTVKYVHES